MPFDAFFIEPFGDATDGRACGLSNPRVWILQPVVDVRPDLIHMGSDKLRTAFHHYSKRHQSCASTIRVGILRILEDDLVQAGEDLLGRERRRQRVKRPDAELMRGGW